MKKSETGRSAREKVAIADTGRGRSRIGDNIVILDESCTLAPHRGQYQYQTEIG